MAGIGKIRTNFLHINQFMEIFMPTIQVHIYCIVDFTLYHNKGKYSGQNPELKPPTQIWDRNLPLVFSFPNNDEIWFFYCKTKLYVLKSHY